MSPENTHKLMGFYMEVLILGVILQYMVSAPLAVSNRVYRVKTGPMVPQIQHGHCNHDYT